VIVAEVARLEQLAPEERLNPEKLMQDLRAAGKNAACLFDVDAIVMHVSKNVQGGDVVVVFSNGGFGVIQGKLMERLGRNQTRLSVHDRTNHFRLDAGGNIARTGASGNCF
jgi:UDP-N-acetylmuramate: L-alanyl-gamma-D-glutamyl-meso-diaminopimelate ligase